MLKVARLLTVAFGLLMAAFANQGHAQQEMRVEPVVVTTDKGKFTFQTEIADTDLARQRGLMFRKSMEPNRAMLFDWGEPLVASMWMQNTYISLDMVFISGNGTVKFVAQNTKPLSRDIVSAGVEVSAVLELIAGTAQRIGLKAGDKIAHSLFD